MKRTHSMTDTSGTNTPKLSRAERYENRCQKLEKEHISITGI